jgi:hypothetical protein
MAIAGDELVCVVSCGMACGEWLALTGGRQGRIGDLSVLE